MELLARGRVGYVCRYGYLLTDKLGGDAEIERWHRQRTHLQESIKGSQ
jgi:hypothetical protein